MNEENTVLENQNEAASISHDSVETPPATPTESPSPEGEETPDEGADETTVSILADTGTDSDPGCENANLTDQKSELDELRSELMQLRQELDESHAKLARMEHIEHQYAEFCELYPDVPISSLSQDVWQSVGDGASLAAAFALAEHRRMLSLKKVADSNANNRARSAGAIGNAESVEFSPAEVRAMTSQEVRANLSKIMRSMQKWH